MSISKPQNRDELRQNILTRLGAPVIEINVAFEQIDIAIDDAFQYFNERSHIYGTENLYLTFKRNTGVCGCIHIFRDQEHKPGWQG